MMSDTSVGCVPFRPNISEHVSEFDDNEAPKLHHAETTSKGDIRALTSDVLSSESFQTLSRQVTDAASDASRSNSFNFTSITQKWSHDQESNKELYYSKSIAETPSHTIARRLEEARVAGRRLYWRVTLPCCCIGTFIAFISVTAWVCGVKGVASYVAAIGSRLGAIIGVLGLLPTDHRAVFGTEVCIVVMLVLTGLSFSSRAVPMILSCSRGACAYRNQQIADSAGYFWACIALAQGAHCFACSRKMVRCLKMPTRAALSLGWSVMGFTFVGLGFGDALIAAVLSKMGFLSKFGLTLPGHISVALVGLLVGAAMSHAKTRTLIQAWLASRTEAISTASGIAALLGRCKPQVTLSNAQRLFRCVTLDDVTKEDMLDGTPDPKLYKRSKPALLGEVDAFVSHSWHDDPESKWRAIQIWRAEFVSIFGREPRVWIDKFCIDQGNILETLSLLPVFVAACNKILVLLGPTYLMRLWCIVELFVFVQMGGQSAHIKVKTLGRLSQELSTGIDAFDVMDAECFSQEDKSNLLALVEAEGRGHSPFNERVKDILRSAVDFRAKVQR